MVLRGFVFSTKAQLIIVSQKTPSPKKKISHIAKAAVCLGLRIWGVI